MKGKYYSEFIFNLHNVVTIALEITQNCYPGTLQLPYPCRATCLTLEKIPSYFMPWSGKTRRGKGRVGAVSFSEGCPAITPSLTEKSTNETGMFLIWHFSHSRGCNESLPQGRANVHLNLFIKQSKSREKSLNLVFIFFKCTKQRKGNAMKFHYMGEGGRVFIERRSYWLLLSTKESFLNKKSPYLKCISLGCYQKNFKDATKFHHRGRGREIFAY